MRFLADLASAPYWMKVKRVELTCKKVNFNLASMFNKQKMKLRENYIGKSFGNHVLLRKPVYILLLVDIFGTEFTKY